MCIATMLKKYESQIYAVVRILVGFLFFQHGAQKLFGWFTDKTMQPLMSLMGIVGFIEFAAGLLIMVGLFTRLSALGSALLMVIAYFYAHSSMDVLLPIMNRGELALVYAAVFMLIAIKGNGLLSLEKAIWNEEMF